MKELEYPFDAAYIIKKRKSLKKALLADGTSRIRKKIAVFGGSTTSDIVKTLELFLLDAGIEPEFYESEYAQYFQDAMFPDETLLSFKPEVYEKIKSGKKIFEHRRNFPDEPIMAYMYVSSPVKAVTGIVYLGKRHLLSDWREEFKNDKDAVARIEKYQESYRYAMEIDEFQETTEISLDDLRHAVPGFVAPQMYMYLDGTELLEYINKHIKIQKVHLIHSFNRIASEQICVH